ncbi:MAG: YiiX/YebB-like N1pC/P60 family cysteine hydrolase [Bacteroidota bacterium]
MNRVLYFLILLSATFGFTSCETESERLQEGDLLFQNLDCGDLCTAIETVTEGVDGKDFSHCAMVVNVDDNLKVIEAIGEEVQVNTLEDFFARSGDKENVTIGRVKADFQPLVQEASAFAKEQIGQPYDDVFLLDNGKWYCSELLHEAFKSANSQKDFFELSPMTYKDPKTEDFFPVWITYYEQLGAAIPEGKPGLNPGSISRSDKIEILKTDKIEW